MRLKKAVVFVLCAVLSLSLIACSKETPGGGGGGGSNKPDIDPTVTYSITFDVGAEARAAGVSNPPVYKAYKNATLASLPTPDWDGHVLSGWFDGNKQFTLSTIVTSDLTLVAHWRTSAEVNAEAAAYEASLTAENGWKSGHLYIHYKRYDHMVGDHGKTNSGAPNYSSPIDSQVYGDWGLWLWPKNGDGRLFNAMKIDVSGAVYDVDLSVTYKDAGWDGDNKRPMNTDTAYKKDGEVVPEIGMQLFQISTRTGSGFWANDGGNTYLTMETYLRDDGTYHVFANQGNVGRCTPKFTAEELSNPYEGDDGTMHATAISGDGIINSNAESRYPQVNGKVAGYDDAGVGYQIFVASFADSDGDGMGDLQGIISKLDYLQDLNVDVLWLTPFQSSTNYHGYDIKDYYSVDPRFGTLADYRQLVYEVHKRGMKIVMDFVLNHTSQANPWFVNSQNLVVEETADGKTIDYRNFYSWITQAQYDALDSEAKKQWYGDAYGYYFYSSFSSDMPELNYDYQPVRDAILEVCNYWMAFGLDGFRLDAVKHIYMKNEVTGVGKTASVGQVENGTGTIEDGNYSYDLTRNINFYREFNYRLKAAYPNAFVVGENLEGNPLNTTSYYQGIDSQFNFNLYYDATRAFAASQQSDLNCGYANAAVTQYINGYYGNAYQSKELGRFINVKGYSVVNPNFIDGLFTSNHDLPRARDRLNLTTNSTASSDTYHKVTAADADKTDKLLRMYFAYNMTMPGLSWIYYGDEIGMTGVMNSTVGSGSTSTTESEPHEDRVYRQPMKWYTDMSRNASYNIGYGTLKAELTELNATDYVKGVDSQSEDPDSLLSWMKTLTKIRNDNPVLMRGKVEMQTNGQTYQNKYTMSGSTIIYGITDGASSVKVYLNVGDYSFNVPSGGEVLASYGMNGRTLDRFGIAIVKG